MARLALCIGINDYPGTEMDLAGCVNDAEAWAAALAARGFMPRLLRDAEAGRAALLTAFEQVIGQARAGDTVAISFSGHGSYVFDTDAEELDGFDEALCPHDVAGAGPVTDDEIRQRFDARADGVRLVLLADSCHSGTVTRVAVPPGRPRPRFLPPEAWLPQARFMATMPQVLADAGDQPTRAPLAATAGRAGDVLLAGCEEGRRKFSYDTVIDGRACGAFSHWALATLAALPPGATWRDWHAAIRRHLPTDQLPQAPQLVGDDDALARPLFG